ncbi:hypothetical protein U1Q18_040462 [Sarracenia purpurea var. burkii]
MEKKWPKMAVFAEKTALGPTKENPVCDKISIEDFVESTGKGVSFEVKVAGEGLENDMKAGNPKPVLAKDSEVKLCALDNPLKVDLASGETDVKSRSEVKLGSDLGVVFSDQSTERLSHGIAFKGPVSGKGDGTVHLGGSKEQSGHAFKVLDKNPPVASERDDIAITGQVHNNVTWASVVAERGFPRPNAGGLRLNHRGINLLRSKAGLPLCFPGLYFIVSLSIFKKQGLLNGPRF